MDSARFMPYSMAALAVRTLARVATFMPQKPARMENRAPITKQAAVSQSLNTPIKTNSATIKITRILYSDFKKASAPSAMAAEISRIRSLPTGAFMT